MGSRRTASSMAQATSVARGGWWESAGRAFVKLSAPCRGDLSRLPRRHPFLSCSSAHESPRLGRAPAAPPPAQHRSRHVRLRQLTLRAATLLRDELLQLLLPRPRPSRSAPSARRAEGARGARVARERRAGWGRAAQEPAASHRCAVRDPAAAASTQLVVLRSAALLQEVLL